MNIVTRSGSEFQLDGKRFRFVGGNTYNLLKDEYTEAELDTHFSYAARDGIKVMRTWAYGGQGNSTGNVRYRSDGSLLWRESGFVQLDRILSRARAHGVRVIFSLTDYWSYGPDVAVYAGWSDSIHGTAYGNENKQAFFVDENIKTWFKEFLYKLIKRTNTIDGTPYTDDPAIFAWELGNELSYSGGTDANANTHASARVAVLSAWQSEMLAYIKSLDGKHLLGIGEVGRFVDDVENDIIHAGTGTGQDYENQAADANCDYFDVHMYPFQSHPDHAMRSYGISQGYSTSPTFEGFVAQWNEYVRVAKAAGRPLVVGEIGIDKRNNLSNPLVSYPRFRAFAEILKLFFNRDIDGVIVWSYHTRDDSESTPIKANGDHPPEYGLPELNVSDERVRSVLTQFSYRVMGERVPVAVVKTDI